MRAAHATGATHMHFAQPGRRCWHAQVKHIMVCGHYNCGAVKAALQLPSKTPGLVNCWISDIRECRNQHRDELRAVDDSQDRVDL